MCEIYVWSHAILIDGAKDSLKSQLNSPKISQDIFKALNVAHAKSTDNKVYVKQLSQQSWNTI